MKFHWLLLFSVASLVGTSARQTLAHEGHEHSGHDEAKIEKSLQDLAPADRRAAEQQRFCPVMQHQRLGAMGTPVKVSIEGRPVYLCCKGCIKKAVANPRATLATVDQLKRTNAALSQLPPVDRATAEQQSTCPVSGKPLGSMGPPVKVTLQGQPVFLCCRNCQRTALSNPSATLSTVAKSKQSEHSHEE